MRPEIGKFMDAFGAILDDFIKGVATVFCVLILIIFLLVGYIFWPKSAVSPDAEKKALQQEIERVKAQKENDKLREELERLKNGK